MFLKWVWRQRTRWMEQRVVIVNEVSQATPAQVFTTPPVLPPTVNFKIKPATSPLEGFTAGLSSFAVAWISFKDYNVKNELKLLKASTEKGWKKIRDLEVKKMALEKKISKERLRAKNARKGLWFFQKLW